mmetsp:Transcript_36209/g.66503  ORF Transcript_36209/g.66503 Transcript_36209/m.66503 type:complete len:604 (-) Transcript_36209:102-1913(-)
MSKQLLAIMKKLAPVLTLFHLANALPTPRRIPDILERIKQQQQEPELQLTQDAASSDDVVSLYYDQRLDHFSKEDEGKYATFKQRYFYTSRYVRPSGTKNNNNEAGNKKNALAFLCVGGEGPSLDASVLVNSAHCTGDMIGLADQLFHEHDYDVHLFAVEHRYYGESFPSQEKEVGYLRGEDGEDEFDVEYTHLSSRQAVQDIVGFVKSGEALKHFLDLSLQDSEKIWITFGGSYPGMLSAWSHLLHPDVIFAAVSNSAPVEARLDFQQYHERVGSDLGDEFVGGSKLCETIVKEGHEQVVAALEGKTAESDGEGDSSEDGVDRVATLFNVCGGAESLRERRNMEVFVGDGVINVPAQSNDPSCEGEICNIKGLCNTIVNERKSNPDNSSMEILAHVSKLQSYSCDNVHWKSYLDYFKTPTKQNANDRSWTYQTCSEFGFYQTCNQDSHCPYGKGYHDVSRDLELCQVAFGIDPDDVKKNVDATLTYYGGWSLSPNTGEQVGPSILENGEDTLDGQKRIIFVTGDVDPWTELAVTGPRGNKDHPSINVHGASHHFWTHEIKDSDIDQVRAARQTIYDTVSEWLGVSTHLVPSAGGETVAIDTE